MMILYIDPGSMTFVVQMLIAGFVGIIYFFRKSLNKVLVFLHLKGKKDDDSGKNG